MTQSGKREFASSSTIDRKLFREKAYAELRRYHLHQLSSLTNLQVHLAEELFRRLVQCQWLERRIADRERAFHREAEHSQRIDNSELAPSKRLEAIMFEMQLLCEAYYLFAWRACECLARLPGFKNFSVGGIRDVRNRLIEHPDREGGVFEWSTTYVSGIGLKLKPMPRRPGQPTHLDQGFWNNVMTFYVAIVNRVGGLK